MADHESTMKWKVDISDLKASMQQAKRSISLANAEFKAATSGMSNWASSANGVKAKLTQLDSTLKNQKSILADLEKAYEKTAKEMGEESAAAEKLRIQILNQKSAIAKTESSIDKYNNKLQDMESETGKLNKSISDNEKKISELKKAYADAVLMYGKNSQEAKDLAAQIEDLSGELAQNKNKLKDAESAADQFDRSLDNLDDSTKSVSDGFTVFKGALANLVSQGINKAIDGVKDLAKQTFDVGSSFEAGMSNVAAVSGATAGEIDQLTAKAKEMGEKTVFSATQASDAFNYMAMAGWKTEDMLGGIEGIMNLAAASGADLATTSDIVTDALTAMGYSAEDAGRLADVMASASSNANTNVEMMGQTFQYAAPIVGALGYSMEDTAVAIGLMANAGIKGEKAGTALRSILTRLSAPPKECAEAMNELGLSLTDSEGNMKSLDAVMGDLRKAFAGLDETSQTAYAKQIAGQEAMSGLLSVVRAAPADYEKLTKAVNSSTGAAERMAKTMTDNVSGQITLLRSKVEGIMIKVFQKASKSIRKAIDQISKALDKVDWNRFAKNIGKVAEAAADFFEFVINNGDKIVSVLEAIAVAFVTYKAVSTIASVSKAFTGLFNGIKAGQSIMVALNTTIGLTPVGIIAAAAAALAGLVVLSVKHKKAMQEQMEAQYGLNAEQQEAVDNATALADTYNQLDQARNESMSTISSEYGYLKGLKDEYNSLIDENGRVKTGYEDRANFILHQLADAMGVEVDKIKETIDANGKLGDSIDKIIEKKQAEATLAANEEMYNEAIKNRSSALDTLTKAQKAVDEAEQNYQKTNKDSQEFFKEYNELISSGMPEAAQAYWDANHKIVDANQVAKKSYEEAKSQVDDAEQAWIGYNTTIQNYEGLSAAIISGDGKKIEEALSNLQNGFITAETGNRESLERQVKNYEENLANLQQAIQDGTPSVTNEMVIQAQKMVNAANKEMDKLPPKASATGKTAGNRFAGGIGSKSGDALTNARKLADNAGTGITPAINKLSTTGSQAGSKFASGVDSKKGAAKTAGQTLASNAESGSKQHDAYSSGSNFGEGFFNGIGSWFSSVWSRAKALAKEAWNGLRAGQQEGSPSKLTRRSGVFFGKGYELGIHDMMNPVADAARSLAETAVSAVSNNLNDQMKQLGMDSGKSLADGIKGSMPNMSASVANLKSSVASANSQINGVGSFGGSGTIGAHGNSTQNVTFNQTINSPKPLSRLSVYRDTNNLLFSAKVRLNNV
ncbi:phage tail tape measure protein [uncultured Methanobrevibacter sp.]|uniref:phage tail tape measure protein n=1 Tax=uncultured Methanobrevibacter sp. TaxID=253161 RepID=UPI0026169A79|nr:phage tail tape measure protein [uncultured Methanobrevibacter sp.]